MPKLQGYILQSRLTAATPYLMEIAAKQRMYKVETGRYCCSNYALDEGTLSSGLGLSLGDAGDFCFVFICQDTSLCAQVSGPGFIAPVPGGPKNANGAPEFEVWAILQSTGPTTSGPGGTACQPLSGKASATGWVQASGSGLAGRAGQVAALRYPPPANGFDISTNFDWRDGITLSNALRP